MPEKWKRCVAKVKAKQSIWCEKHGYPFVRDPSGKKCTHPYKVCAYLRGSGPEGPGASSSPKRSHKIYIGPRGGRYYINSSGNKVYLKST